MGVNEAGCDRRPQVLVVGIGRLGWLASTDALKRNERLPSQSGAGFGAA